MEGNLSAMSATRGTPVTKFPMLSTMIVNIQITRTQRNKGVRGVPNSNYRDILFRFPNSKMKRVLLFLCVLLALQSWLAESSRDGSLYDILGVSRHANQKEIRSAYKRLAREWHPDKNKSPEAQDKIMEINKAYEVRS